MSDDLAPLREWIGGLIGALETGERKKLNRRLAIAIRRANAQRMAANVDPDGAAFAPRKPREDRTANRRGRGRIKKRKMFLKAKSEHFLKKRWTPDMAGAEFTGPVGRIMRVHQFGLQDSATRGGHKVRYPARRVLGFNETDESAIAALVVEYLASV